uniref:Uncharacterized protein n=1 Tax=Chelonoidis abingdonii TaxID=106734 RepID=A0A8C0INC1_CHEAB
QSWALSKITFHAGNASQLCSQFCCITCAHPRPGHLTLLPQPALLSRSSSQEELCQKLALQLARIGDAVDHRIVREFRQDFREETAHFILFLFRKFYEVLHYFWARFTV